MEYHPNPPHGHVISTDAYFTLMADADGVGFVHCDDGVLVVPLTSEGEVLLGVERAPGLNRDILLAITGIVETGETLEETANRELQEELGWRAEHVDFVGELCVFKYLTARMFVFLARELVSSRLAGDERYSIQPFSAPIERCMELCHEGVLSDALTIGALTLTRSYLLSEKERGESLPMDVHHEEM